MSGAHPGWERSEDALHEDALHAGGAAVPGEESGERELAADVSPLAALLTRHVIPPGEVIVLLLKPSLLFVPLTSMMTLGFAAVVALAGMLFDEQLPGHATAYVNAGLTLGALRLMWATLQWMGRYYVLTDVRVMAVSGVFATSVQQCVLRRVARVRLVRTVKERACLLGSLEVIPMDEEAPIVFWQSVGGPWGLKERLQRAVARAKGR